MDVITGEQFIKALALLAAGIAMGFGAIGPVLVKDLLVVKRVSLLDDVQMKRILLLKQ